MLAASGVVGEPIGGSPFDEAYIGSVRYLGAVCTDNGERLNIRQFAVKGTGGSDCGAPVFLILGTSGEVGKTTAGIALVRMLRLRGHETVVALKATGSCSVEEIASYEDFGAAQALDCLDFGLPGTYPIGRDGIGEFFASALDFCLALPADAVVIECGSDLSNPNVREFLDRLIARRPDPRITLAAADALGALAAKQLLLEMGLSISLITGPCADTPALRERTSALCGVPTISLVRRSEARARFDMSALTA
ncbi:MAG TPA: hypothetical protein VMB84_13730 [Stellaceae bacterium]|nr:hypothetical protein [Stellaceae bacterium]